MDKNNDKHNNRKKTESGDILGMIRKRQEEKDEGYYANQQSKLRDFLNNLHDDGTIEDYSETPIYRMGFSDGQQEGYDKGYSDAYYELFSVLKAIETVIQPHIERQ